MPTSLASYPESNMTPEPFFKDERALSQPLSESSSFVGEENDDSNSQTIYSESIPPWKKNQENLLQQVEVREKSVKIAFAELARIKLVLDPHKKIPEVKQLLAAIGTHLLCGEEVLRYVVNTFDSEGRKFEKDTRGHCRFRRSYWCGQIASYSSNPW